MEQFNWTLPYERSGSESDSRMSEKRASSTTSESGNYSMDSMDDGECNMPNSLNFINIFFCYFWV